MTVALSAKEIVAQLSAKFPGAIEELGSHSALVKSESLLAIAEYLKELKYDYFNFVTAADYYSYFELVYMVTYTEANKSITFKTRVYTRDNPNVDSVIKVWRGADFQEREIYDMFGIKFNGHPDLRRILLWEGFDGHPLRKDWNR